MILDREKISALRGFVNPRTGELDASDSRQ